MNIFILDFFICYLLLNVVNSTLCRCRYEVANDTNDYVTNPTYNISDPAFEANSFKYIPETTNALGPWYNTSVVFKGRSIPAGFDPNGVVYVYKIVCEYGVAITQIIINGAYFFQSVFELYHDTLNPLDSIQSLDLGFNLDTSVKEITFNINTTVHHGYSIYYFKEINTEQMWSYRKSFQLYCNTLHPTSTPTTIPTYNPTLLTSPPTVQNIKNNINKVTVGVQDYRNIIFIGIGCILFIVVFSAVVHQHRSKISNRFSEPEYDSFQLAAFISYIMQVIDIFTDALFINSLFEYDGDYSGINELRAWSIVFFLLPYVANYIYLIAYEHMIDIKDDMWFNNKHMTCLFFYTLFSGSVYQAFSVARCQLFGLEMFSCPIDFIEMQILLHGPQFWLVNIAENVPQVIMQSVAVGIFKDSNNISYQISVMSIIMNIISILAAIGQVGSKKCTMKYRKLRDDKQTYKFEADMMDDDIKRFRNKKKYYQKWSDLIRQKIGQECDVYDAQIKTNGTSIMIYFVLSNKKDYHNLNTDQDTANEIAKEISEVCGSNTLNPEGKIIKITS